MFATRASVGVLLHRRAPGGSRSLNPLTLNELGLHERVCESAVDLVNPIRAEVVDGTLEPPSEVLYVFWLTRRSFRARTMEANT